MYVEADTMGGLASLSGVGSPYKNNYGSRDVGIIACKYDEFFHQTLTEDGQTLQAPYFMEESYFAQIRKDRIREKPEPFIMKQLMEKMRFVLFIIRHRSIHGHIFQRDQLQLLSNFSERHLAILFQ